MSQAKRSSKKPSQRKVRRSREQWQSILDEFEKSALTMNAFCAQQGLPVSSFFKWRSVLSDKKNSKLAVTAPLFVEIPQTSEASHSLQQSWDMELELGNGVILRMRQS